MVGPTISCPTTPSPTPCPNIEHWSPIWDLLMFFFQADANWKEAQLWYSRFKWVVLKLLSPIVIAIWLYLRSLVHRRRDVTPEIERGNPLEDLVPNNTPPPPTTATPAWGAAKAFVEECKAWGEGLEGRLHDAVRSEALAKREAAEARAEAAEARVEVTAVKEREKAASERVEAASERVEAANRGKEEALSQLRAEVDKGIEQRKLWLNRENELLRRIRDLESVANS